MGLKRHPQHSLLTLLQKRLRFQTHYPIRVNSSEVYEDFSTIAQRSRFRAAWGFGVGDIFRRGSTAGITR